MPQQADRLNRLTGPIGNMFQVSGLKITHSPETNTVTVPMINIMQHTCVLREQEINKDSSLNEICLYRFLNVVPYITDHKLIILVTKN